MVVGVYLNKYRDGGKVHACLDHPQARVTFCGFNIIPSLKIRQHPTMIDCKACLRSIASRGA